MTTLRINVSQLGKRTKAEVQRRLVSTRVGRVLVAQAKARIRNGGDSEHKYPELWDHPKSYRAGGQPLRNSGQRMSSLTEETRATADGVSMRLKTPFKDLLGHQKGYKTKGPNFIPLTRKAEREYNRWSRAMKALSNIKRQQKKQSGSRKFVGAIEAERRMEKQLDAIGLVEGEDYVMAWNGVTVPQRKIFNMAPENLRELRAEIKSRIGA